MTELEKLSSRPVYIEWLDSQSTDGWSNPDRDHDLRCRSLGFLVRESDESVTVATNVSAIEDVCNQMTIPRIAITRLEEIRWG